MFFDVLVAVAIGVSILLAGRWGIRLLATPGPGDPDPAGVVEVSADYRCTVCGMQLTVTHAQGDEFNPPRHCREEMETA